MGPASQQQVQAKVQKGWLSRWTRKQWSRHWFVLKNGSITYYRGPAAELCSFLDGVLDLSLIKHIEVPQQPGPQQPGQAGRSPPTTPPGANFATSQQQTFHALNYHQNLHHYQQQQQQQQQQHQQQQQQTGTTQAANAGATGLHFDFTLKMWNGECHLLSATSAAERQSWLAAIHSCGSFDDATSDSSASSESSSMSQSSNLSAKSTDIGKLTPTTPAGPTNGASVGAISGPGAGNVAGQAQHNAFHSAYQAQQQQQREAELSLEHLALKLKSVVRRGSAARHQDGEQELEGVGEQRRQTISSQQIGGARLEGARQTSQMAVNLAPTSLKPVFVRNVEAHESEATDEEEDEACDEAGGDEHKTKLVQHRQQQHQAHKRNLNSPKSTSEAKLLKRESGQVEREPAEEEMLSIGSDCSTAPSGSSSTFSAADELEGTAQEKPAEIPAPHQQQQQQPLVSGERRKKRVTFDLSHQDAGKFSSRFERASAHLSLASGSSEESCSSPSSSSDASSSTSSDEDEGEEDEDEDENEGEDEEEEEEEEVEEEDDEEDANENDDESQGDSDADEVQEAARDVPAAAPRSNSLSPSWCDEPPARADAEALVTSSGAEPAAEQLAPAAGSGAAEADDDDDESAAGADESAGLLSYEQIREIEQRRKLEFKRQLSYPNQRANDEDEDSTCELVRRMIERRKLRLLNSKRQQQQRPFLARAQQPADFDGHQQQIDDDLAPDERDATGDGRQDGQAAVATSPLLAGNATSRCQMDTLEGDKLGQAADSSSGSSLNPPLKGAQTERLDQMEQLKHINQLEERLKSAQFNIGHLEERLSESYSNYNQLEVSYKQLQLQLLECQQLNSNNLSQARTRIDELELELKSSELKLLEAKEKLLKYEEHLAKWQLQQTSERKHELTTGATATTNSSHQHHRQYRAASNSRSAHQKTASWLMKNSSYLATATAAANLSPNNPNSGAGGNNSLLVNLHHDHLHQPLFLMQHLKQAVSMNQQQLSLKLLSQSKQIQRKLNELESKVDKIQSSSSGAASDRNNQSCTPTSSGSQAMTAAASE